MSNITGMDIIELIADLRQNIGLSIDIRIIQTSERDYIRKYEKEPYPDDLYNYIAEKTEDGTFGKTI